MNVICICLDTFRADIVGPGKALSHCRTPNLDDLYSQAVAFEGAYGEGQPTLQIRRAFFTGRRSFPWRYNFDRRGHWHHAPGWHKIPPEQDTLAEILLARGYYTGLVADTYHMFKPTMNYTRGFAGYEFIRGQESDNWRGGTPAMVQDAMLRHVREPINWQRHSTLVQYLHNQRFRQSEDDYQCARVFRRACEWLDECCGNAPFLLWIDSFDPHEPWDPPERYADLYCSDYEGKQFIMPGAAFEGDGPTDLEIQRTRALYLGECTFVDKWVGMLLEKVDALKLMDDTLIVVLSDHGTEIMDHGGFGKGAGNQRPYNARTVWYLRHPDGPANRQVTAYAQSHDVMPTILDLLGVPYEAEGVSAWPLVTRERDSLRDYIVCGWAGFASGRAGGSATVRDGRWRYSTMTHLADAPEELYALEQDPAEESNVASAHPDIVALQRERIEAVVGQPLPAEHNEVCDPAPAPMAQYMAARKRVPS